MSYPGGIGRVTAQKANYLANKGHEVSIITEIQGNDPFFYKMNNKIQHFDIGLERGKNKIIKLFIRKKRIKALLDRLSPNIVIYTYPIIPIKTKTPYKGILECHFNHDTYILKAKAFGTSIIKAKLQTKYQEYVASKFRVLVVLTEQDKDLWKNSGISNTEVIPNMNSFETNETSTLDLKNIIAVGRLDAQKSFDRLIKILAKVIPNHKDWKLNIYGQGPDKEKYLNLINQLNLTENIIIHEPTKDIKAKYLESSILCFTSTFEGWGLVLTEAMTCGLPVVSYDTLCGPKDIIQNSFNGFLIPNGNEQEYIKSLIFLMDNKEQRKLIGKNAKESVDKYNVDSVMTKWENLFNHLQSLVSR